MIPDTAFTKYPENALSKGARGGRLAGRKESLKGGVLAAVAPRGVKQPAGLLGAQQQHAAIPAPAQHGLPLVRRHIDAVRARQCSRQQHLAQACRAAGF